LRRLRRNKPTQIFKKKKEERKKKKEDTTNSPIKNSKIATTSMII